MTMNIVSPFHHGVQDGIRMRSQLGHNNLEMKDILINNDVNCILVPWLLDNDFFTGLDGFHRDKCCETSDVIIL
jgi:hypothetical protein